MRPRKKVRIGDLLVQSQVISDKQLSDALAEQKRSGRKLGRTLIEMGMVKEHQLLDLLSRQLQIPFIDLKQFKYKAETVQLLSETHARRFRAIVLDDTHEEVLVAFADPTDIFAYDEISRFLKKPIKLAVTSESDILYAIDRTYRKTAEISSLAGELHDELEDEALTLDSLAASDDVSDAPVVKLLQHVFEDAVQVGASDIHIEPDERVLRIRQRVDGVLQEHEMKETRIAPALVVRLKLLAGLDISEKRLPQDGRFNIKVKDRSIDIRVSTLPIQNGESVVMRLLDQTAGILSLDHLGLPDQMLASLRSHLNSPHGMVLVTGPTGSGKTTTLYAALSELNKPSTKIITAEDPVEYRLPRINQVQINEKVEMTFSKALRAALRQDPDVVLIGEMRDKETAQIGLRAAMTGHFVLSTLHTNDAVSTANRLIDMGCEGFLVSAALKAIVAQRLVRRICDGCAEPFEPEAKEKAWLRSVLGDAVDKITFQHGRGCQTCHDTGYRGRVGVYEMLEIDEDMADALRRESTSDFVAASKRSTSYIPLSMCALDYAAQGVTTLEEVFRIAGEANLDMPDESIEDLVSDATSADAHSA